MDGDVPDTNMRTDALRRWVADRLAAEQPARTIRAWTPVRGDASFRRFHRVTLTGDHAPNRLVAMDAPPATENNPQFVALSALFRAHGVHVPQVLASDFDRGFLLVDDLGERLYADVYATGPRDAALESALRTLVRIQGIEPDERIPPYTAQRFRDELDLFTDWLLDRLLGTPPDVTTRPLLDDAFEVLLENALAQPRRCVHRDYHSRNLLMLPDGTTGVVDFQDALWGPITYDLASLLRDCYVRFDDAEVERWQRRYLALAASAGVPVTGDAALFSRWFDRMSVQRHLKAAGIFARLHLRDGKDHYLRVIPGVLGQVIAACAPDPALDRLAVWLAGQVLPAAHRRIDALTARESSR
jgi:N-acetylmuramate 1-kinase